MLQSPSTCDLRPGTLRFMSLKRGIGPRSTSLLMSLGLCLRASDCENAWKVGLARRAENAGCLFTPPLLNRSAIGWPNMCWCQEYKSAHRTRLRIPTTTSHSGGHPPIEGRDERERCARKRSEAERVGCAITPHPIVALGWMLSKPCVTPRSSAPRRCRRGDRTQARRPHNRQTRGALSPEAGRGHA